MGVMVITTGEKRLALAAGWTWQGRIVVENVGETHSKELSAVRPKFRSNKGEKSFIVGRETSIRLESGTSSSTLKTKFK